MRQIRKNPITGSWVIISSERGRRPRDFVRGGPTRNRGPTGSCPFCEGNEKATPAEVLAYRDENSPPNASGWQVRVVPNKFPALCLEENLEQKEIGIFGELTGVGAHEVIIESPHHRKTLVDFDLSHLTKILCVFRQRSLDLKKDQRLRYILLFKNYGSEAAASLEHPHSQLIATPVTPWYLKEELEGSRSYYGLKGRCIFCDIITQEIEGKVRVIEAKENFIVLAPFASRFPFEMWILPRRHCPDFDRTGDRELRGLADALRSSLRRLSSALDNPPYNLIFHTAPSRTGRKGYWDTIEKDYHWHIEIIPRVIEEGGFEWATGFHINPTFPEDAATHLRQV